jgi:hypothetical protein
MLQVFVSWIVTCLLLLFACPSLGFVKHVLNKIYVVKSFPAGGRFIKCTSTTHLLCFDSDKNSTVENQYTTEVGAVRDVCISLQQFSGELSGVDTLANKVLEHHGLILQQIIMKTKQFWTGGVNM